MSAPAIPSARSEAGVGPWSLDAIAFYGVVLHAAFLPISIAGMQIGLVVSFACLMVAAARGERVWFRSELDLPMLALLGAVLFWPWDGPVGTKIYRTFAAPLILVSVLGRRPDRMRRDALLLLAVWAGAAMVPAVLAWFQHRWGTDLLYELGMRSKAIRPRVPLYRDRFAATGFFSWYIRLAHNLTAPLCLLAALCLFGGWGRRRRVLGAVACVAVAAAVFLTFTRTAWYGLAVAALVLAWFGGRRVVIGALVAMALVVGSLYVAQPGFRARVESSLSGSKNRDRIGIWETCAAVLRDHPLTGIGFGNMPTVGKPYFEKVAPRTKIQAWCHNTFFTSYVEGGAVYLGATLLLWGWLGWVFWRRSRDADALGRAACAGGLAALAAMGVNALAHDIFYASETMYGFGFALALAVVLMRGGDDPRPAAREDLRPA